MSPFDLQTCGSLSDGLALRGTDEDTGEEDNNACFSTYSGLALQVTQLTVNLNQQAAKSGPAGALGPLDGVGT